MPVRDGDANRESTPRADWTYGSRGETASCREPVLEGLMFDFLRAGRAHDAPPARIAR
jgi:hypothetical protein